MQNRDLLLKKTNKKLEDAYINICESYVSCGHLYVFEKCIFSLCFLI
jgi:hypothetical protein